MDITWNSHACFTLKGSTATVVIDPFDPQKIGLTLPKLSADVLLISHGHGDHNHAPGVTGGPYVIDTPGEYESHGVMIEGIPTFHDAQGGAERGTNIVFSIRLDGIHLVHLGDLGHVLTDQQVEQLGDVDILFLPVGGEYTIAAKEAVDVVKQLQPRVTVPMHYDVPGLSLSKQLAGVNEFLKQAGSKHEDLEKSTWKIKASDLPVEESLIVVFPNP